MLHIHKYFVSGIIFISCSFLYFYLLTDLIAWIPDDAFIFFRYAENAAEGRGLVFNPDEYVEGYTSPIWVWLLAASHLAGLDIYSTSLILGVVTGHATLFLVTFAHVWLPAIPKSVSYGAAFTLSTFTPFLVWSIASMEFAPFTLAITGTVLYFLVSLSKLSRQRLYTIGILLGIVTLLRPEGMLVTGILTLVLFFNNSTSHKRVTNVVVMLTPFLILTGSHQIWRLWYYHDWLPNTFRAKVGYTPEQLRRGLTYLWYFVQSSLLLWIGLLIAMINQTIVILSRKGLNLAMITVLALTIPYFIYVISIGGDYLLAFRFFVPMLPIFCIISVYGFYRAFNSTFLVFIFVFVITGFNIIWYSDPDLHRYIRMYDISRKGRDAGIWINHHTNTNTVIAANSIGAVGYYADRTVIDMLGIIDSNIARTNPSDIGSGIPGHEKGNGEYILNRNPDFIFFGNMLGSKEAYYRSDHELVASPTFHHKYQFTSIVLPSGHFLNMYKLKR